MTAQSTIKPNLLVPLRVIWASLTISIILLAILAFKIVPNSPPSTALTEIFSRATPIIALCCVAISSVTGVVSAKRRQNVQVSGEAATIAARELQIMIIQCLAHEGIAIMGFLLALSSRVPESVLGYSLVALVANLFVFPSRRRLCPSAELPKSGNSPSLDQAKT